MPSFNLIDNPWIPVADVGLVSLTDVFTHPEYRALSGNPIQKISLMKLLLAIAQAACTPKDETEWKALGVEGITNACLKYLDKWHDRFDLYGERPFLQMTGIVRAAIQPYGAIAPDIATGNTTVLLQSQVEPPFLPDANRASLLLQQMAFALSGKKTDNSIVLSPNYVRKKNDKGKPSSAKPGSAIAHLGLLHNFWQGETLQTTLWLNLLSEQSVMNSGFYPEGVGVAPWEDMPIGEDCPSAQKLRKSLQGRLIPLGRFCLLSDQGLHYSEGILHDNYKDKVVDPSVAVDSSGKDPKALWTDPQKRPWRELTALLSFFGHKTQGFSCLQLRARSNIREVVSQFGLWSGGLRVSSNAGEQYVSGMDDFVESTIWFSGETLGEPWFVKWKIEMQALDQLNKTLYACVMAYFKVQKVDGKEIAAEATSLFWQLCEREAQHLVYACGAPDNAPLIELRRRFATYLRQTYNQFCPQETARQMDAWAQGRPNIGSYLSINKGESS